ncbi:MAG TPA: methyltransferase domain-containing protein [Persephonella sp.]|uniref:Tellurite resistance protein TehB n=1 Tax=Persephonella marina (strain DSM 14350 / EX-H1) TaxID=123214 RepID=C0QSX6_PERMH|nr:MULTISPECIES: class I SAM-dependent methyltransferase [Persephonella]ACO04863.1 tellurite resistance protein TehB [Persephonella marina EX-H1]HCB70588.1 methyltransferase domain-containing protein [Persephonella sp.]
MEADREKWNRRYTEEEFPWKEPSQILKKFYRLSRKGKALDIAAGLGRNSLFLAEKGFEVDAVELSDVAVEKLKNLHKNINVIQEDLDFFSIPEERYDLILNINYLNRRLFPQIIEGLKKDGVLIFETFLLEDDTQMKKDYLLRENELLHSFLKLHILFYEEKKKRKPTGEISYTASLVGIKRC